MKRLILLTTFAAILAVSSGCAAPVVNQGIPCDSLADWSQAESDALGSELYAYGEGLPMMTRAIREYRVIRKSCRE